MTMRILPLISVTATELTNTNVAEDDAAAYDSGTTYAINDQVIYGHHLYTSLVGSNLGNQPDISSSEWFDEGATNRYKAFDEFLDTATTNADTIEYEITPGEVINAIALFRVVANSVQVIVTDPVEGEVYNQTKEMQDTTSITNWFAYFFEPIELGTRVLFDDLPQYRDAVINIVIDYTGSTAAVGLIALGRQRELGVTLFGTSFGITDFSRVDRDEFGAASIVLRGFVDRISYDVEVDTGAANTVKRLLQNIRSTPTVFIGVTDREETVVYGLYKDWTVTLRNARFSACAIEVEGLI